MPIATITANFAAQAAQLEAVVASQAAGNQTAGRRLWAMPFLNGYSGNPYDIQGIGRAYDRSDANNEYQQACQNVQDPNGGRLADRLATKFQVDNLSSQERAFKARHSSSIRCSMLAAARRKGQALVTGVYAAAVDYCGSLINEGYSQPRQPAD